MVNFTRERPRVLGRAQVAELGEMLLLYGKRTSTVPMTYNKTLLAQPLAAGTVHCVARPKARR